MKKKITLIVSILTMILAFATVAYAAGTYSTAWVKDGNGIWHAKGPDGNYIKNAWFCDDAVPENVQNVWYLIDENGCMITAGLVQDGTGNFYSIETNICGYYGMLRYQNGYYNCNGHNVPLVFEQEHNGSFGAIRNPEGLEALKQIYGIKDVSYINNSNAVHSAGYAKTVDSSNNGGISAGQIIDSGSSKSGGGGGGSGSGGSGAYGGGGSSSGGGGSVPHTDPKITEQDKEIQEVIKTFKAEYIKTSMTDFEKEMQIIQWMVENIDYDFENYLNDTIPSDSYTTYGALVKHVAVCDGYSKAFKEMGEACGLKVESISGEADNGSGWQGHAWNQILLDGEWYNVDVTWEDPTPSNDYGFGFLRNTYINCTDADFPYHRASDSRRHACTADKYGHDVVEYYLEFGEVKSKKEVEEYKLEREDIEFENEYINGHWGDFENHFIYEEDEATIAEVVAYLGSLIQKGTASKTIEIIQKERYNGQYQETYDTIQNLWETIKETASEEFSEYLEDTISETIIRERGNAYGRIIFSIEAVIPIKK